MRGKEKTFLLLDSPLFLDDRKDYFKLFRCQCCEAANYENCPIIGHIGLWHGARREGMISDNKKLAIMHAIMRVSRCLRGIERRALLAAQWKRCRLFCSTAFVRRLLHRLSLPGACQSMRHAIDDAKPVYAICRHACSIPRRSVPRDTRCWRCLFRCGKGQ